MQICDFDGFSSNFLSTSINIGQTAPPITAIHKDIAFNDKLTG